MRVMNLRWREALTRTCGALLVVGSLPACARYVVTTEAAVRDPWAVSVVHHGVERDAVVLPGGEPHIADEQNYATGGLFGGLRFDAHREASGAVWVALNGVDPQTLLSERGAVRVQAYDHQLGFDVVRVERERLRLFVPYEYVAGDASADEAVEMTTPLTNVVFVRERREPMRKAWSVYILGTLLTASGGAIGASGLFHPGFEGATRLGLVGLGSFLLLPGLACLVWAISSEGASSSSRVLYGVGR